MSFPRQRLGGYRAGQYDHQPIKTTICGGGTAARWGARRYRCAFCPPGRAPWLTHRSRRCPHVSACFLPSDCLRLNRPQLSLSQHSAACAQPAAATCSGGWRDGAMPSLFWPSFRLTPPPPCSALLRTCMCCHPCPSSFPLMSRSVPPLFGAAKPSPPCAAAHIYHTPLLYRPALAPSSLSPRSRTCNDPTQTTPIHTYIYHTQTTHNDTFTRPASFIPLPLRRPAKGLLLRPLVQCSSGLLHCPPPLLPPLLSRCWPLAATAARGRKVGTARGTAAPRSAGDAHTCCV